MQKLIHLLNGLVVLIEYLQIIDRSGGLDLIVVRREGGDAGEGASTEKDSECHGSDQHGAKLTAGVEEKARVKTLEPASLRHSLIFAQANGKFLVEV